MLRKILSLVCILALALAALGTQAFAANDVLTFSYWGAGEEKAAIETALRNFTEATGIPVEPLHIPTDYSTKLTTMAAAGTLPDVGYLGESETIAWAENGATVNMTDIYTPEELDTRLSICQYHRADGDVVGLSFATGCHIITYNKTLFDEAGLPYPPANPEDAWTWDEFLDVCIKLTKDANGLTPADEGFDPENIVTYAVRTNFHLQILTQSLMASNNGGFFSEDLQELWLQKPESLEVLQAFADLMNVHHVHPTPAQGSSLPDTASAFLSGRLAMQMGFSSDNSGVAEAGREDGLQWDVGVLPVFNKGENATYNFGAAVVIFSDTAFPEEAKQLALWMTDPQSVLPMLQAGISMPTAPDWYTDEAKIDEWLVEGVHPDSYREAVIDYAYEYWRQLPVYSMGCYGKILDVLNPALDRAWAGDVSAEEAVASVIDDIAAIYEEEFLAKR